MYSLLYSPEDQAILEDAYSRDSKPDKDARLALVNQVDLGEKEVQVCTLVVIHPYCVDILIIRYGSKIDDRPPDESQDRCSLMRSLNINSRKLELHLVMTTIRSRTLTPHSAMTILTLRIARG